MKNFLLLIYYNTLALPFGIKLLALAALLATSLQYFRSRRGNPAFLLP